MTTDASPVSSVEPAGRLLMSGTVDGFPIYVNAAGDIFMRDLDVAAALEMAKPHNIRTTIESHAESLGEVFHQEGKTSEVGGRPGRTFFLLEWQAMFVAAKIRTKAATTQLKRLIAVYMEARNGNGVAAVAIAQGVPAPRLSGGDDQLSLTIATMRGVLDLGLKLQEFAANQQQTLAKVDQHGMRLALVENTQRQNAAAIVPISPAQPALPPISKRKLINEHVLRYAAAMGIDQHTAWRTLYFHCDRRLSIAIGKYKLNPGESKLDRLESLGLLDKVGKVCDTDLQVPPERMRELRATTNNLFTA